MPVADDHQVCHDALPGISRLSFRFEAANVHHSGLVFPPVVLFVQVELISNFSGDLVVLQKLSQSFPSSVWTEWSVCWVSSLDLDEFLDTWENEFSPMVFLAKPAFLNVPLRVGSVGWPPRPLEPVADDLPAGERANSAPRDAPRISSIRVLGFAQVIEQRVFATLFLFRSEFGKTAMGTFAGTRSVHSGRSRPQAFFGFTTATQHLGEHPFLRCVEVVVLRVFDAFKILFRSQAIHQRVPGHEVPHAPERIRHWSLEGPLCIVENRFHFLRFQTLGGFVGLSGLQEFLWVPHIFPGCFDTRKLVSGNTSL